MSPEGSDSLRSALRQGEDWRAGYPPPALRRGSGGPPWGLLVTGLVVVGLGLMAWNYLGPESPAYLKISNM